MWILALPRLPATLATAPGLSCLPSTEANRDRCADVRLHVYGASAEEVPAMRDWLVPLNPVSRRALFCAAAAGTDIFHQRQC